MASGSGASVGEQSVSEEILKKWAKWEKETVERIRDRGGCSQEERLLCLLPSSLYRLNEEL